MQEIAIYVLVVAAFIYLGFKLLIPKKKKGSDGKDCDKCA
jgi:hypothetical protein